MAFLGVIQYYYYYSIFTLNTKWSWIVHIMDRSIVNYFYYTTEIIKIIFIKNYNCILDDNYIDTFSSN
jgi:hypothetical protein